MLDIGCKLNIRPATIDDAALILDLIRGLALYEKEPDAVKATEDDIRRDGFGPQAKFQCVIAEWQGRPAGFALFFYHYSTWLGRAGIFLEDLFVLPELRGNGIGKALLRYLAERAVQEGCYGLRWQVLDWNQPAIDFYKSFGSDVRKEWIDVRLTGESLKKLAQST